MARPPIPPSSPRPHKGSRRPPRGPSRGGDAAAGLWLFGLHPVLAALANPQRKCLRLLATRDSVSNLPEAGSRGVGPEIEIVERDAIDAKVPPGAVHQGLALEVAPLPVWDVADLLEAAADRPQCFIVALDQVTDPHNVGAVMRSAAAFGALGVMVPDRHAPDETGTLAKAASGALEIVPLVRVTNLARALGELNQGGFWSAGLAADAPAALSQTDLAQGRTVIVLGSEGEGLRRLTRETCDYLVNLPMPGKMESLNVSNAAAIAMYELTRPPKA